MTGTSSVAPDFTEALPALLSARQVSSGGQSAGVLFDLVISGVGCVFAIDTQNPMLRESQPIQKQQIDTSAEAGEQTLDSNWTRSQTSWHLGAGADYYEPGSRDETSPSRFRFKDSRGVDVWTPGQISLLPQMDAVDETTSSIAVCGARPASLGDVWYSRVGDTLYRHDSGGTTLQLTDGFINMPGARMAVAGSKILFGSTSGVYQADLLGSSVTQLTSQAIGTTVDPYWVKSRLISVRGNALHQHTLAGGPVDATSLLWEHPDSGWKWTGVTETPDAILAAGYSGGVSAIYAFTLTEDGAGTVPKLSQPFAVAEFPPGEEVRSLQSYLGSYLGVGTTAGIRVAAIGQGGQVTYGPLLLETDDPVVSLGARDSFMYAAAGNSVIRVNLAEPIGDGLRFPYAYDVELPDGVDISAIAFVGVGNRLVAAAAGVGTFVASATDHVPAGWLESGDIRYATTVPKSFRTLDVTASTSGTTSVVTSVVSAGTRYNLVTLSDGKSGRGIGLGSLVTPMPQVSYRLDLTSTDGTPVVEAVAVRAIPVPHRQRLIQYPVQCTDRPRDAKGTAFGREGYASTLLAALEELEEARAVVTVQDKTRPEQFEATIEKVEFARVQPRAGNGAPNFGGIAKITVRTL